MSSEFDWREVFVDLGAGTFGGIMQVIAGHPLDTVKVRLQTQERGAERYGGVRDCIRQIWRKEGATGFFKGMSSPLAGMACLNAVLFCTYAQTSRLFAGEERRSLTLAEQTMSGGIAGFAQCIIVSPTELVKARLQVQASRRGAADVMYNGPLDCVRKTVQRQGVRGLFVGMSGTIYREIPAYAALFGAYETFKGMLLPADFVVGDEGKYPFRLMLAGGLGGVACWTISYPQDVVLNRLRVQPTDRPFKFRRNPYLFDGGFFDCARRLVQREGLAGLWKGYTPCALRAFPANAASFLGYEFICSLF
jgi:solute carrier family 25 (mitochondrial carnitine/acylcarnitine transporter), member 20/29